MGWDRKMTKQYVFWMHQRQIGVLPCYWSTPIWTNPNLIGLPRIGLAPYGLGLPPIWLPPFGLSPFGLTNPKWTCTTPIWTKGSSRIKKTVKKADIVRFGRPPPLNGQKADICCLITDKCAWMRLTTFWCQKSVKWPFWPLQCFIKMFIQGVFFNWDLLKVLSVRIYLLAVRGVPVKKRHPVWTFS